MAVNLDAILINIIVSIIVVSPVLWIAGRVIVGKESAKFTDAVWIVVLGIVIGNIFGYFFTGLAAAIVQLVIWLALVKHFFDSSWPQAIIISLIAIVIFVIVAVVLALLGFALFSLLM